MCLLKVRGEIIDKRMKMAQLHSRIT